MTVLTVGLSANYLRVPSPRELPRQTSMFWGCNGGKSSQTRAVDANNWAHAQLQKVSLMFCAVLQLCIDHLLDSLFISNTDAEFHVFFHILDPLAAGKGDQAAWEAERRWKCCGHLSGVV